LRLCASLSPADPILGAGVAAASSVTACTAVADFPEPLPMDLEPCAGGLYDPSSDLCWEDPPGGGECLWEDAAYYCAGLSLGDHGPGAWHLPTIDELRSLVRGCLPLYPSGDCPVTDPGCLVEECRDLSCSPGWGCPAGPLGGPAGDGCFRPNGLSGSCSDCWSSSPDPANSLVAWSVNFYQPWVDRQNKQRRYSVRCVRRGP
jgi:hypothetical protein